MRRNLARICFLATLPMLAIPASLFAASYSYFPNKEGDTWNYKKMFTPLAGGTYATEITNTYSGWRYYDNFLGSGRWLWVSNSGTVYQWNNAESTYQILFKLGASVGTSWEMRLEGSIDDHAIAKIDSRTHTVSTPAGTFENCILLSFTHQNLYDAGLSSLVFAPGVGVVQMTEISIYGGVVTELVSGMVGGVKLPKEDALNDLLTGWGVALQLPERIVKINLSLPSLPVVMLNPTLVVYNRTGKEVVIETGVQEYDFVVRDSAGNVVYRWSDGKAFIALMVLKTLAPGTYRSYPESLSLGTFAQGSYTLEGYLTGSPSVRATVSFRIEHVYGGE